MWGAWVCVGCVCVCEWVGGGGWGGWVKCDHLPGLDPLASSGKSCRDSLQSTAEAHGVTTTDTGVSSSSTRKKNLHNRPT